MHLVERAKNIMVATGAEWVLWLLVVLSIASIAVIIERVLALRALRLDVDQLRGRLIEALRISGFAGAREVAAQSRHPAARVVLRVLEDDEASLTEKQAEDAMSAESIAQRRGLERRFNFLATLGANAPFIGLFGTVVGILQAFDALGAVAGAGAVTAVAPQAVMGSIAEALVATAVGLGVAIPAVFAYNVMQRTVKSAMDDAQMLSLEVLSYMSSRRANAGVADLREARASQPHPSGRSPLRLECTA